MRVSKYTVLSVARDIIEEDVYAEDEDEYDSGFENDLYDSDGNISSEYL